MELNLRVLLALLIVAGALPARAQQTDSLTARVERAVAEEQLVGVTWSLLTPEGVSLGAAGVRDVARGTRLSPSDRVHVGSVTKTLVATGILSLITEGRIALDAHVSVLLPELQIENPWERNSPLRVRHLLDHTGGLDDARLWQVFTARGDPDSPLAASLSARQTITVRHQPGARFSYSNSSYLVLGLLIERITGERYETWLDKNLLAPLGMHRSTFLFITQEGASADSSLAMGHFDPETPHAAYTIPMRPSSQFTTTAEDMATFARFLMSDGVVNGQRLVDAQLLEAMAHPALTEASHAGLAAGYALGMMRRERWGLTGKCHLGNVGTFRAIFCVYPPHQRAFFAAYNSDPEQGNFDRVDSLLASSLGVPKTVATPTKALSVDPAAWNGWYVVRPNRFAQFAYLDELMGVTRIVWTGSALELRPVQGAMRSLEPMGDALFRAVGRREATHVVSQTIDSTRIVSDGLRTYEQVARSEVLLRWLSAFAGIVALLYLLLIGGARAIAAARRRAFGDEVLRWPALVLWLMVLAPALYLTQSFLALGDVTPASVLVAVLTGALPLTIAHALYRRVKTGLTGARARTDAIALVAALQWCLVLVSWGLVPLTLWR